jgi:hypothetical protein
VFGAESNWVGLQIDDCRFQICKFKGILNLQFAISNLQLQQSFIRQPLIKAYLLTSLHARLVKRINPPKQAGVNNIQLPKSNQPTQLHRLYGT